MASERQVKQIATAAAGDGRDPRLWGLTVLCYDGTMWEYSYQDCMWSQIPPVPGTEPVTPEASDGE